MSSPRLNGLRFLEISNALFVWLCKKYQNISSFKIKKYYNIHNIKLKYFFFFFLIKGLLRAVEWSQLFQQKLCCWSTEKLRFTKQHSFHSALLLVRVEILPCSWQCHWRLVQVWKLLKGTWGPLLCSSCPANVFLCFIKQSLDKVTMGQSLPARVTQTGQKRQWEPRRNSTHPSTISSRTKDILKCAWKARESNFAWEIWILWWNPGLVISFSLHLSKEAETGTNNGYRIYLFGNICERVSQHWVHFTGIIKPDRIL